MNVLSGFVAPGGLLGTISISIGFLAAFLVSTPLSFVLLSCRHGGLVFESISLLLFCSVFLLARWETAGSKPPLAADSS